MFTQSLSEEELKKYLILPAPAVNPSNTKIPRFHRACIEDPRISREDVITKFIPQFFEQTRHLSLKDLKYYFGLTIDYFFDFEAAKYLPINLLLEVLQRMPYSNKINSNFVRLLNSIQPYKVLNAQHMQSPSEQYFGKFIRSMPIIFNDKNLLRNLIKLENTFVVAGILSWNPRSWNNSMVSKVRLYELRLAKNRNTNKARESAKRELLDIIRNY